MIHFRNVSKLASYYTTLQFVNNLVSREMANLIKGNCLAVCYVRMMASSCLQLQCLCLQAPQHFPPVYLPAGNIENSSGFFFSACVKEIFLSRCQPHLHLCCILFCSPDCSGIHSRSVWPQTQRATCLCLLGAPGIKGVCLHLPWLCSPWDIFLLYSQLYI